MLRPACVALILVLLTMGGARVRAQERETPEALFERGTEALLAGRFPEARDLLSESLRREPDQATGFNLVVALLGVEQPLEAARVCERLLGGELGPLVAERRTEADRECSRARAETSVLEVTVRGPSHARATVRLDGAPVSRTQASARGSYRALVNPGVHVVTASADGFDAANARVETDRGERRAITLAPVEQTDLTWWYVGGAAAAVAAAAAIVVVVIAATPADPERDPVFGLNPVLSSGP